jgi:hypothetical protein
MKTLSAPLLLVPLLIAAVMLLGSPASVCAQGVSISFVAVDLDDASGPGGDYWEYQYRVSDPGAVLQSGMTTQGFTLNAIETWRQLYFADRRTRATEPTTSTSMATGW